MVTLTIDITLPRRTFDLRAALSVDRSETVALVGPSGAGKTSLLRAVAGLERPSAGRITLGDRVWLDRDAGISLGPAARRVGYLPQDYGLFPHLTVAGNVRFAAGRDRPDLLERFGISDLAAARPASLSGGERQRVALARALAREPRVLLLDEPFGALDVLTHQSVREELARELESVRLPTLLVTHQFDDAVRLAGRIGVLDGGQVVQLGVAEELQQSPATRLVAALTGANILTGVARRDGSGSVISLDGGGEMRSAIQADGRVDIAIHPWAVRISDHATSSFTDTITSVQAQGGQLVVRGERLTVHLPHARDRAGPALQPGTLIALDAATSAVRVFPAEDRREHARL